MPGMSLQTSPQLPKTPYLSVDGQGVLGAVLPYGQQPARERTHDVLSRLSDARRLPSALAALYGGQGFGVTAGKSREFMAQLRAIGAVDLAAGRIYEGHVNALLLLQSFATPAQLTEWSQAVHDGHWFGVWNTDSDTPVTAEMDADGITLHGGKSFCSGTGRVTRALITAKTTTGRQMLIVPMEQITEARIDRSAWRPLGMESSESHTIDFSGLRLPRASAFGEPNAYLTEPWFTGGSIRFAAVQFGAVETLARELYQDMRTRAKADDTFQQFRCGEVAVEVESGQLWLDSAAKLQDAALSDEVAYAEEFMHYARMTRTAIEKLAIHVLSLVDRSVGAHGLREPLPFAQLHRDLTMYLRQPAPDAVLTAIGRQMLANRRNCLR